MVKFGLGTRTEGNKASMAKKPSLARIGYLDEDKAKYIDQSIEKNRLETTNAKEPDPEHAAKIDKLNDGIYIADQKVKGFDQEHKFHVVGFLKDKLDEKGFDNQNRNERIKTFHQVWNKELETEKMKGNDKGIISFYMSPSHEEIKGLSPEMQKEVMKNTINQSMDDFKDKYYKEENISYAYSFHMDKLNKEGNPQPHAHIYLYPYTETGTYIALRAAKYDKYGEPMTKASAKIDKNYALRGIVEKNFEKEVTQTKEIYKEKTPEVQQALKQVKEPTQEKKDMGKLEKGLKEYKQKTSEWNITQKNKDKEGGLEL